jgi:hypothetical protein
VAKKTGKRSATKKVASRPSKVASRPAAKPLKAAKAATKPAAPAARLTLGERAEGLRDEIQRSKLTHPDPWRYAPKARGWGERAQVLVELIVARGDTASARGSLEALAAELRGDRDFQEARRLF